jgi:hypothetical protein
MKTPFVAEYSYIDQESIVIGLQLTQVSGEHDNSQMMVIDDIIYMDR